MGRPSVRRSRVRICFGIVRGRLGIFRVWLGSFRVWLGYGSVLFGYGPVLFRMWLGALVAAFRPRAKIQSENETGNEANSSPYLHEGRQYR